MSLYHNRQSQFELFPGATSRCAPKKNSNFFLTKLTFPLENIIVFVVAIVMSMVVAYSFGVEKGKSYADSREQDKNDIQEIKLENSDEGQAPIVYTTESDVSQVSEKTGVYEKYTFVEQEPENQKLDKVTTDGVYSVDINTKNYTIQVASFKKEEYAQREAMELKKKGYEILVLPKGDYSIVCVGKFVHKDEARKFSDKLKNKYKDCLIRSL